MCLSMWSCKQLSGPLSLLCPGTTLVSSSSGCFSPPCPQSHLTHHRTICHLWGQYQSTAAHAEWIKPLPVQSHCDSRQLPARLSHWSACALTQGIWQVPVDSPIFCSWHGDAGVSDVTHFMLISRLLWTSSGEFFYFYGFLTAKPLHHLYWCPKPVMDTDLKEAVLLSLELQGCVLWKWGNRRPSLDGMQEDKCKLLALPHVFSF